MPRVLSASVAAFLESAVDGIVRSAGQYGKIDVWRLQRYGIVELRGPGLFRVTEAGMEAAADFRRREAAANERAARKADQDALADEAARLKPIPRTRAECVNGPRPCPHIRCRHNLGIDIAIDGKVWENDGAESCALDAAEAGGMTLEQIGQAMGLTQERVRQVEVEARYNLGMALWRCGAVPFKPPRPKHIENRLVCNQRRKVVQSTP